jgi:hypothetical protein
MVASAEAQEFAEDLASGEASIANLITAEEAEDMAGSSRTWDFGPSLMTEGMIEELQKLGVLVKLRRGLCKRRLFPGRRLPTLWSSGIFFLCGLPFPAARFLRQVLERLRYNCTTSQWYNHIE